MKAQNAANIDLAHTEKLALSSTKDSQNAADNEARKNNTNKIEPTIERDVTHKIKKGETLQSIARRYDVSVKQILAINTLKSTQVKVGQTLKIKTEVVETPKQSSEGKVTHKKKAANKHHQVKSNAASNKNKVKQESSHKKSQTKVKKQQQTERTKKQPKNK